jgi:hypothetical protein
MLCACRLNNRCGAQQLHKKRDVKAITNNPFSYMHSHFRYLPEHPKRIPACRDKICKKNSVRGGKMAPTILHFTRRDQQVRSRKPTPPHTHDSVLNPCSLSPTHESYITQGSIDLMSFTHDNGRTNGSPFYPNS